MPGPVFSRKIPSEDGAAANLAAGKIAGKTADKIAAQAEMLANRLRKRQRHLGKWARRTGAGAYRLYDRDIPEIPLVLDRYAPVPSYAKDADSAEGAAYIAGALYGRPYEKDGAEEAAWLEAMKNAAAASLAIPAENIFLRFRRRQRTGNPGQTGSAGAGSPGQVRGQYGRLAEKRVLCTICEGGLSYRVNLSDYLDTGFFPDRRLLRARLRSEAARRRILNLFCYTGSLSVAVAAGGAASVDSVDLSAVYLAWARENAALNGLEESRIRFIRADVLRFVEEALRQGRRWDTIILDPPAFSNSKKMAGHFDLKRDHAALIRRCLLLLEKGGTLYLSANVKGFRLDKEGIGSTMTDITETLRDEDMKGRRIPAAWKINVTETFFR
ncbi:MAG: class I SAM-dependent methyltransferase [Treponema sp.]|jgi:23S rRNA G2069 N7-methylase RlmK/C1962 C5-methylase RlmI|nr:class I SAM-dependent methyltransferase [Treponema sp.]